LGERQPRAHQPRARHSERWGRSAPMDPPDDRWGASADLQGGHGRYDLGAVRRAGGDRRPARRRGAGRPLGFFTADRVAVRATCRVGSASPLGRAGPHPTRRELTDHLARRQRHRDPNPRAGCMPERWTAHDRAPSGGRPYQRRSEEHDGACRSSATPAGSAVFPVGQGALGEHLLDGDPVHPGRRAGGRGISLAAIEIRRVIKKAGRGWARAIRGTTVGRALTTTSRACPAYDSWPSSSSCWA
jgi:hypothetical protein